MMTTSPTSFSNQVFGTLPKQYCLYFYILCIIAFIIVVFSILSFLFLFTQKNIHFTTYVTTISLTISYLLIYLTYRLLYSMCISSLK